MSISEGTGKQRLLLFEWNQTISLAAVELKIAQKRVMMSKQTYKKTKHEL